MIKLYIYTEDKKLLNVMQSIEDDIESQEELLTSIKEGVVTEMVSESLFNAGQRHKSSLVSLVFASIS